MYHLVIQHSHGSKKANLVRCLSMIYLLKIVIFHSYVKLPGGMYTGRQKGHSIIYYVLLLYNSNIEYVMGCMINNFGLYINYIEHIIYI